MLYPTRYPKALILIHLLRQAIGAFHEESARATNKHPVALHLKEELAPTRRELPRAHRLPSAEPLMPKGRERTVRGPRHRILRDANARTKETAHKVIRSLHSSRRNCSRQHVGFHSTKVRRERLNIRLLVKNVWGGAGNDMAGYDKQEEWGGSMPNAHEWVCETRLRLALRLACS